MKSILPMLLLTRWPGMLRSGLQESVRSRRSAQAMVIPLARAATRSWRFLEDPNIMIMLTKGHFMLIPERRYQYLLENDYNGVLMPCRREA